MTRGPLKGKKVEMATRQAEAAVAAGSAAYVDPRPAPSAPAEKPPVADSSWLGPPGENPSAAAPASEASGSWLGPPGEAVPPPPTPVEPSALTEVAPVPPPARSKRGAKKRGAKK